MTANRIGADLATFIETMIGEPAYVTGNSSGGLLTAWLAANRPELVRAIVLEDSPLFAAEYPRIKTTIPYRSFATCSDAVRDGVDDFLPYWIHSSRAFFAATSPLERPPCSPSSSRSIGRRAPADRWTSGCCRTTPSDYSCVA